MYLYLEDKVDEYVCVEDEGRGWDRRQRDQETKPAVAAHLGQNKVYA